MGGIFLRDGDTLIAMREQPYEAEDVLQALIADHPEILVEDVGDDVHGWVLVKREAGVPDRQDGADRWGLDHLFLDHAGVPTLIEVKRSSDTRIRREYVGQMLDYAANAARYWSLDSVRTWFEAQHADPQSKLDEAFGVTDYDSYWETVKINLAADRIRLVFVADEIPAEVRSIVEFLNRQMKETEVLAIEVKQYVDARGERQTIVPRVLGQTEATKASKSGVSRVTREWDEQSMLADLAERRNAHEADLARSVLRWARDHDGVHIEFGKGAQFGSALVLVEREGLPTLRALRLFSSGQVEIPLRRVQSDAVRGELRRRINEAVPGVSQGSVPSFYLRALEDDQTRQRFFAAMEWAFDHAVGQ